MRFLVPLDRSKGVPYTKPIWDEYYDIDKIKTNQEDWINPTTVGKLGQEQNTYFTLDSKEELENWENRLYEVSATK